MGGSSKAHPGAFLTSAHLGTLTLVVRDRFSQTCCSSSD